LVRDFDAHLTLQIANQNKDMNLLKTKLDEKESVISQMEDRLAYKDQQFDELNEKFDGISKKMDTNIEDKDKEINDMKEEIQRQLIDKDKQIRELKKKFDEYAKKMNTNSEEKNKEIHKVKEEMKNQQIKFDDKHAKHETTINSLESSSIPHCPHVWKIENFEEEFQDSKKTNKDLISKSFYCMNGYKARLNMNLNGYGDEKDSHISSFFQIMKGPFDDSLEWPMPYDTITIKLIINEKLIRTHFIKSNTSFMHKNKFIRPNKDEGTCFGASAFFPHNELPKLNENVENVVSFHVDMF